MAGIGDVQPMAAGDYAEVGPDRSLSSPNARSCPLSELAGAGQGQHLKLYFMETWAHTGCRCRGSSLSGRRRRQPDTRSACHRIRSEATAGFGVEHVQGGRRQGHSEGRVRRDGAGELDDERSAVGDAAVQQRLGAERFDQIDGEGQAAADAESTCSGRMPIVSACPVRRCAWPIGEGQQRPGREPRPRRRSAQAWRAGNSSPARR